jgi:uncharacterized membrane protein YtjA (UPF0391 family)
VSTCSAWPSPFQANDREQNRRRRVGISESREIAVLKWALIFFVVSVVAGIFGFSGISAGAATIAKWLFFAALAIFAIFLIFGLMAGEALL